MKSSGPGGDRTHDRGIMRWEQLVGLVGWRRIGPASSEFFSRRYSIAPLCQFGMWDETWDFDGATAYGKRSMT
jgi:hypothetical protein